MDFRRKDLNPFFHPKSIAIVGVPTGSYRFGGISYLQKLQDRGFPGRLYPINPKAKEIRGLRAYPDLRSLPEVPDLAIVCVPADRVPETIEECGRIGLQHIHILTAGFRETRTEEGRRLEERIRSISKERGLLVIGPNGMGPYCPSSGLTAWGAIPGLVGPIGVISQSGGIAQRLTEYTCSLGVGIEKAVSVGNGTVLNSIDFLEFMAEDERIRVIAMYLESVEEGRPFLDLVERVNRKKPVVIWKGGETDVGSVTAASHTGKMAGDRNLWEAFFRQTGAVHVHSMDEWADAVIAFSLLPAPRGKGVFLVGGGGGNSVTNSDRCIRMGLDVPPLSPGTMEALRKTVPLAGCIAGNPLDMWRVFQDAAYLGEILELGYRDPSIAMIVVDRLIPRKAFHTAEHADSTAETIEIVKRNRGRKPTVFTIDSDGGDPELAAKGATLRREFSSAGVPAFPSFERACRALLHLYRYHSRWGIEKGSTERALIQGTQKVPESP